MVISRFIDFRHYLPISHFYRRGFTLFNLPSPTFSPLILSLLLSQCLVQSVFSVFIRMTV